MQVSLDLASFEVVQNCSATLKELLGGGTLEIVFCNEEEAVALTEVNPLFSPALLWIRLHQPPQTIRLL